MKAKLKVAVIGCGTMGQEHLHNLLASGYCQPTDVIVSDLNPEVLEKLQERLGVRTTNDSQVIMDDPEIDAVLIACSNRFHAEMAIQALEAGKHVLLEKPMALNEEDARNVVQAAKLSGKILQVGFELRASQFPKMVKAMKEELGDLVSGQVMEYRGHFWPQWKGRRSDGGSMYLMEACHMIDLFRWLAESEVAEVHAIGSEINVIPHYEYPDTQFTSLVFKSGFVAHITLCHTRSAMPAEFSYSKPGSGADMLEERFGHQYEYSLIGTKGALRFVAITGQCYFYRHEAQPDGALWQRLEEAPLGVDLTDLKSAIHDVNVELREFLEAVATGGSSSIDPEDALETHLVCFAAEKALRARRPVTAEDLSSATFHPEEALV